jgi:hypothetical protein
MAAGGMGDGMAGGIADRWTRRWGMSWRSRIRPWAAAAIVIVLAGGLFWMAVTHVEKSGGAPSSAAVGEAMSEAAHQRLLTP